MQITIIRLPFFLGRLQKLTTTTLSIRQLVNWVYMTQHWPYHMAWLVVMLDDEENGEPSTFGPNQGSQFTQIKGHHTGIASLIAKVRRTLLRNV